MIDPLISLLASCVRFLVGAVLVRSRYDLLTLPLGHLRADSFVLILPHAAVPVVFVFFRLIAVHHPPGDVSPAFSRTHHMPRPRAVYLAADEHIAFLIA